MSKNLILTLIAISILIGEFWVISNVTIKAIVIIVTITAFAAIAASSKLTDKKRAKTRRTHE